MEGSMTKAAPPKRAVGIVRVSQVKGREEEEGFASPSVQRERIADVCERMGLRLVGPPLEEMDVSGGKALDQRARLLGAIEAVEAGRVDVIVVAYFDRLVRSLEVQAQVLRRVEEAGGRVLAADIGEVSNGTAAKWLSATMLGMVAEYHNRITAEKAADAQRRAIERGIPPIILPPGLRRPAIKGPGGKLIRGDVELDPELQPVVAEAVRMRAKGAPVQAVREFLAEHGIRRSYHGTTTLLKSRLLIGEIVFGANRKRPEDVWRGTCPAVVDRATWERAQRASTPRGRKAKSDRLLARLGAVRQLWLADGRRHGEPQPPTSSTAARRLATAPPRDHRRRGRGAGRRERCPRGLGRLRRLQGRAGQHPRGAGGVAAGAG
jgi:DNA invertase Pin-like site-specific DNA recombinase